jgi:hypothetical protein
METHLPDRVRSIVGMLVARDYAGIERETEGQRLTAAELENGVAEYGRTLVMPPEHAFQKIDVVQVTAPGPRRWSIRFDLWSAEEGRSDLSLEMTIIERADGTLMVEVDDLHVL